MAKVDFVKLDNLKRRDKVCDVLRGMPTVNPHRIDRIQDCSSIEIARRTRDGRIHHMYANRCHDRLCPVCQQLRHKKAAAWLRDVDKVKRAELEERAGKRFTDEAWYKHYKFMTFSPFVSSHDLNYVWQCLQWGSKFIANGLAMYFNSATYVDVKPIGVWKSFEVTYDPEKGFHPHFHVIYLYPERAPFVDVGKLRKATIKAMAKEGLLAPGQETVSIDLRDCYKKNDCGAEFELTKYITKFDDYLDDPKLYCKLILGLGHLSQFRGSGCFKGWTSKERYEAIVQNAKSVQVDIVSKEDVVFFSFYGANWLYNMEGKPVKLGRQRSVYYSSGDEVVKFCDWLLEKNRCFSDVVDEAHNLIWEYGSSFDDGVLAYIEVQKRAG